MTVPAATDVQTTSKARQLRELNQKYRDQQTALNQAQASVNRAVELMKEQYQREYRQIMSSPYYES